MDRVLFMISSEIVPLITSAVVLYCSIIGMKRLKLPGFICWVWAGSLGIIGHIILDVSRSSTSPLSASARHSLWIFWCVGYTISALLGTYGTVQLVRHLVSRKANQPEPLPPIGNRAE